MAGRQFEINRSYAVVSLSASTSVKVCSVLTAEEEHPVKTAPTVDFAGYKVKVGEVRIVNLATFGSRTP
jgi:hypothetical protein